MILPVPTDPFIAVARFFLCCFGVLVAYLVACGLNHLFELFSGRQGRGPRPNPGKVVDAPPLPTAKFAPGLGSSVRPPRLPPDHIPQRLRSRRPFQPPPLTR